jgi:hypothetical protein
VKDKKYIYQFSNHTIEEFACYLCPALKNVNCAVSGYSGYSGFSGYSGYSGRSGYSGYSGFSGYSGYSGQDGAACAVEEITVSQGQALISNSQVDPCGLYLITDAYNDTCQIYIRGLNANTFDQQGFGLFTNAGTPSPVNVLMKYDIVWDKVTEVYQVNSNIRLVQSYDVNAATSIGNVIDTFPLYAVYNQQMNNFTIADSTLLGAAWFGALLNIQDTEIINSTLNVTTNVWSCVGVKANALTFTGLSGASGADALQNSTFNKCSVTLNNGTIIGSVIEAEAVVNASAVSLSIIENCHIFPGAAVTLTNDAVAEYCTVGIEATLSLNASTFLRCNIGNSKTVNAPAGYNATSASLEDLDSTFEVFIDPDVTGVLNMINYRFAGIIRIGTTGVPASWDLKQITNFPTSHIFCIVPADSNLVDVYDAGAGGNNIYLSTTAVVTYDGDKDDTLVVRSGLNSSSRLFQIGGWQAPSA